MILPGWGEEAQNRISSAKVLVVGAGGLGCPVLQYLAAAGVGQIGVVDGDVVDTSNLHRQVLYTESDTGKNKAEVAAQRCSAINSEIEIKAFPVFLSTTNAQAIIGEFDLVVDATDNFPTRFLLNDCCVLGDKILVFGTALQSQGQVTVFNHLNSDGTRGPNYRDLLPDWTGDQFAPNCASAGVMGPLTGVIGSLQATEVLKVIAGSGEVLSGKILSYDASNGSTQTLNIVALERNSKTNLILKPEDYIDQCDSLSEDEEISPETFLSLLQTEDMYLVDVREPHAYDKFNQGGHLLPSSSFDPKAIADVGDKIVVFICRSGKRSAHVLAQFKKFSTAKSVHVKGGYEAVRLMEKEKIG